MAVIVFLLSRRRLFTTIRCASGSGLNRSVQYHGRDSNPQSRGLNPLALPVSLPWQSIQLSWGLGRDAVLA